MDRELSTRLSLQVNFLDESADLPDEAAMGLIVRDRILSVQADGSFLLRSRPELTQSATSFRRQGAWRLEGDVLVLEDSTSLAEQYGRPSALPDRWSLRLVVSRDRLFLPFAGETAGVVVYTRRSPGH